MQLQIAICDDEAVEVEYLSSLVQDWATEAGFAVQLQEFSSAEQFLFSYADKQNWDILLLDIQMGQMDGVVLAKEIRAVNQDVQIVFITGFPDFMAEGYEVAALHYLMKPVSAEKLFQVLHRGVQNRRKPRKTLILPVGGEQLPIPMDTITYVETSDHSILIHTPTQSYSVKMSLQEIRTQLSEMFILCHRCYLVNMCNIKKITKSEVTLDNGQSLPLARRQYEEVNQAMLQYLTKGGDS